MATNTGERFQQQPNNQRRALVSVPQVSEPSIAPMLRYEGERRAAMREANPLDRRELIKSGCRDRRPEREIPIGYVEPAQLVASSLPIWTRT